MKKIRCISVDIDGTFIKQDVYDNNKITSENINALLDYCKSGGIVVFSTGRDVEGVIELFEFLKEKGFTSEHIPYLVCLNGGVVLDTNDNFNKISVQCFKEEVSRKILGFLQEKRLNYAFINANKEIFVAPKIFSYIMYIAIRIKKHVVNHTRVPFREDIAVKNVQKIMVWVKLPRVHKLKKEMDARFSDVCYCSTGPRFFLEAVDNNVNKFFGLQVVSSRINVPIEEFAAIGNEQNDLMSLENVGFGVGINLDKYKDHLYWDKERVNFLVRDDQGTGVYKALEEMKARQLI